mmetsp:Transcript_27120/g.48663  ORF Transcript_27120/g.48663 Transcript_27120/m.48663 type:complete len:393 (+) Transcript_27120:343-1521(+)
MDHLFEMKPSLISNKISKLEESAQSMSFYKDAQNTVHELKIKYDRLHNIRKRKAKLLQDLKDKLNVPAELNVSVDLTGQLSVTEGGLALLLRQIEEEEILGQTYEYMRITRVTGMKVHAARYRKLNERHKQESKKLKESQTFCMLEEKELERILGTEREHMEKYNSIKQGREEKIKNELLNFKGKVEFEVYTDKTRSRRKKMQRLKSREKKLELLEEAYNRVRTAELTELNLDKCKMSEHDKEKSLRELKKATRADSAEDVVFQYEDVIRRRHELEQLEFQYETQIEAKKKELKELKEERNLLNSSDGEARDLIRLESEVLYRESSRSIRETDLKNISKVVAQVTSLMGQINNKLKKVTPELEDPRTSSLRPNEVQKRLDMLLSVLTKPKDK